MSKTKTLALQALINLMTRQQEGFVALSTGLVTDFERIEQQLTRLRERLDLLEAKASPLIAYTAGEFGPTDAD